jgi:hypothetical protein
MIRPVLYDERRPGGAEEMALRKTKQNVKEATRELKAAERKAVGKFLARSEAKLSVRFKVSNNSGGAKL